MANILICSNNKKLIEKCTKSLAADHKIRQVSQLSAACEADIVILDTCHVDKNTRILTEIKKQSARFLLTGSHWPEENQINALLHAASGYFDQTEPAQLLSKAIKNILQGDIWVQRQLIPKVIQAIHSNRHASENTINSTTITAIEKFLSNRELDVAKKISSGESNKQIAHELNISERTVKAHLTSIFKKLNVSDRLHLAILMKESN